MKSIIQQDKDRCYLCGGYANGDPLDRHHVYSGADRKKSEKYGLTVYLHHNKCHIFGERAVHNNARVNQALQAKVQKIAMEHYGWTIDDFLKEFYQNYIL